MRPAKIKRELIQKKSALLKICLRRSNVLTVHQKCLNHVACWKERAGVKKKLQKSNKNFESKSRAIKFFHFQPFKNEINLDLQMRKYRKKRITLNRKIKWFWFCKFEKISYSGQLALLTLTSPSQVQLEMKGASWAKAKKSQTVKFKRKVKTSCILSSRFTIKSRTASIVRKKLWTPFQIRLIKYKKRSMPAHAGKQQRQQQQLSDRQHLQQLISNGKNNKHC